MITDWFFYLVATPAVMLLGMTKGGFAGMGILSLPLLTLAVSPVQAAAISLPILMVQDVVSVWAFRKSFHRKNILFLLPGGLLGVGLGTVFAAQVSDGAIKLLMGVIASGFILLIWLRGKKGADQATRPSLVKATIWGTLSGFTSFITNSGGPPLQIYLLPQKLPPQVYAGTFSLLFAILNYVKFAAFLKLGQVSQTNLMTSAVLFPLAIASTFVGVWLVRRITGEKFYAIIYALTFIIGLRLIYEGILEVLASFNLI